MTEHRMPFSCCGCGVDLHEPAEKFYDDNRPLCRECHERYIAKKKAERDLREMLKPGRSMGGRPAYRMRLGDYESLREAWVQGKLGRDATLAKLAAEVGETFVPFPYFDPSPVAYVAAYFKKREASVALKHQEAVTHEALRRTFDEEAARAGVEIEDAGH
jgi:hypothetical protein